MPESEYSTGDKVFMIGGILFFVLEMKLLGDTSDNLALLFLEFLCMCFIECLDFIDPMSSGCYIEQGTQLPGVTHLRSFNRPFSVLFLLI